MSSFFYIFALTVPDTVLVGTQHQIRSFHVKESGNV